jgi:hypothetical protein
MNLAGLREVLALKLMLCGAGVPEGVILDRGPQFTSKFWAAFCHHLHNDRRLSTAYHPYTDGHTERQNKTLKQYLRAYVNYSQDHWAHWQLAAEFAYNKSVHALSGVMQFYSLGDFHPRLEDTLRAVPGDSLVPDVPPAKEGAEELVKLRVALEQRWSEAVAMQQEYSNRRTKPSEFAVGNMVWLSGKNICTRQPCKKLDHRFYRPYSVTEWIGTHAYRLQYSQQVGSIYDVFHVSLLEPYSSDGRRAPKLPPPVELAGKKE